jgi:phosphoribosylformylglycinamidine synthase
MLGLIEELDWVTSTPFRNTGDNILLIGETFGHVGGSEYLAMEHDLVSGDAPPLDLSKEKKVQDLCLQGIRAGLVHSAHDCAEGGLGVALAECCFSGSNGERGAIVDLGNSSLRPDFLLFGEDQSRILLSATPASSAKILSMAQELDVPARVIGVVGGKSLIVKGILDVETASIAAAYFGAIEEKMAV